ncbi:intein-containing Rv2578c family radical SAM protein [Cellulomonas xiejunii]|uniref:intein-containing Rv2578c family radical SAM protein n=1 Tax=Cellulomonas xiejunii TaxID=2968083 RepID=UPI001D0E5080|nr:intein-containing Rv2578c family radical SAM protein [Cellulomonas xiejunii]MCC2314797.1 intein-containing Rv2578c family radical SAM protein [Cellulomonas xiejunii]
MRWDGQKIDAGEGDALPGLDLRTLPGLVRSVRTPDFAGVTFHEVLSRTALNRVPDASAVPFRWTVNPMRGCLHACTYCLDPSTSILMADGRQRALADLRVGDQIVGTRLVGRYRRYVATEVLGRIESVKPAYRVRLADGTEIIASGEHRFLTERGWKHVTGPLHGALQRPYLTGNNSLVGFGRGIVDGAWDQWESHDDYRRGYLAGMIRGDGMMLRRTYRRRSGAANNVTMFRLALADVEALDRTRHYLEHFGVATHRRPFVAATPTRRALDAIFTSRAADFERIVELMAVPDDPASAWHAGFLSGAFDAEGSCSGGIVRISNKDEVYLAAVEAAFASLGLETVREGPNAIGVQTVRLRGGRPAVGRFFAAVQPAITRKLQIVGRAVKSTADLRVVEIEPLGAPVPLLDITTGTGDFVANGVIAHNCFARGTHRYLDLDAGKDFDTQIVVKTNVAEVLRAEVARRSWAREHVALGTNTDPYQRPEGRYTLMPGIIEALAGSGTPLSVLTKGTLLRRDLPLLAAASHDVPVSLAVSIAVLDEELQQQLEPGTPTARARLSLVRAIRDAGLPVQVLVAPVLPWLTDSTDHLDRLLGAVADAGAQRATVMALHLRPGAREWFLAWLTRERPELVAGYGRVFRGGSYVHGEYRAWLDARVRPLLAKHGLDRPQPDAEGVRWARRDGDAHPAAAQLQPALF